MQTDGFGVRLLFSSTYHDMTIVSSSFKTLYRACSLYMELVLQLQSRSPLVQIPATQNILLSFKKNTSLSEMGQEQLQLRKMLIREWFLRKHFFSELKFLCRYYFICIFSLKYVFPKHYSDTLFDFQNIIYFETRNSPEFYTNKKSLPQIEHFPCLV